MTPVQGQPKCLHCWVGDYFFGGITSLDGTPVSDSDILIKYTRNGEADLHGMVVDNDVSLLIAFYGDRLRNPAPISFWLSCVN